MRKRPRAATTGEPGAATHYASRIVITHRGQESILLHQNMRGDGAEADGEQADETRGDRPLRERRGRARLLHAARVVAARARVVRAEGVERIAGAGRGVAALGLERAQLLPVAESGRDLLRHREQLRGAADAQVAMRVRGAL